NARRQQLVEARGIAALMDHAALVHDPHEIRLVGRHLPSGPLFAKGRGCNTDRILPQTEVGLANLITERVELARRGQNPYVICRMKSGWLVIGDVQPLPGYCVLLADPVVESINTLDQAQRAQYSLDVIQAGDAVLAVTEAYRINYETLGNNEPALHTHIIPRYQ